MKKQIIRKGFTYKGTFREVRGTVEVIMNDKVENATAHNAITHDDNPVIRTWHKVASLIDDKQHKTALVRTEEDVLKKAEEFVLDLRLQMKLKGNEQPKDSFETKLNKILNS